MATLTIKNMPDALYERLRTQAQRQRRSMNQEAIFCIERVVSGYDFDEEALQADIQAFREEYGTYVTLAEIQSAIDEGHE